MSLLAILFISLGIILFVLCLVCKKAGSNDVTPPPDDGGNNPPPPDDGNKFKSYGTISTQSPGKNFSIVQGNNFTYTWHYEANAEHTNDDVYFNISSLDSGYRVINDRVLDNSQGGHTSGDYSYPINTDLYTTKPNSKNYKIIIITGFDRTTGKVAVLPTSYIFQLKPIVQPPPPPPPPPVDDQYYGVMTSVSPDQKGSITSSIPWKYTWNYAASINDEDKPVTFEVSIYDQPSNALVMFQDAITYTTSNHPDSISGDYTVDVPENILTVNDSLKTLTVKAYKADGTTEAATALTYQFYIVNPITPPAESRLGQVFLLSYTNPVYSNGDTKITWQYIPYNPQDATSIVFNIAMYYPTQDLITSKSVNAQDNNGNYYFNYNVGDIPSGTGYFFKIWTYSVNDPYNTIADTITQDFDVIKYNGILPPQNLAVTPYDRPSNDGQYNYGGRVTVSWNPVDPENANEDITYTIYGYSINGDLPYKYNVGDNTSYVLPLQHYGEVNIIVTAVSSLTLKEYPSDPYPVKVYLPAPKIL